jgi:hypothetical protein
MLPVHEKIYHGVNPNFTGSIYIVGYKLNGSDNFVTENLKSER